MGMKISKSEVCRNTGTTLRNLQFFLDERVIIPAYIPECRSKGRKRYYSPKNMVEIILIQKLAEAGVRYRHAINIMKVIAKDPKSSEWDPEGTFFKGSRWAEFMLISKVREDEPKVQICMKKELVRLLEKANTGVIVVNMEQIVVEVCDKLRIGPDYEDTSSE